MIKKIILLFVAIISFVSAEGFGQAKQQVFLKPEEAFKVNIKKIDTGLEANITLGKDIYIYQDSIKISLSKPETKILDIVLPKPTIFHNQKIYENVLFLNIPKSLLKNFGKDEYEINISFEGCAKTGVCYAPVSKNFTFEGKNASFLSKLSSLAHTTNVADIVKAIGGESYWFVLLLFFIVGLLLALTPCILPMIPILSAIIVSQSYSTKPSIMRTFFISLIYVLSMSLTYAIAGMVAGRLGVDMQTAMQNPWIIILFSVVFVALAMSLFGFYEIGIPVRWQNKLSKISDNASSRGGIIGTAIMGFLSALIVGPCVAPALGGAILFISQTGDTLLGGLALFVMSIGMGVPLLLMGIGAGKWMPKPGRWMTLVSRFFGIIMLALAIMMASRITTPMVTMLLSSSLSLFTVYGIYKNRDLFRSITIKLFAILISIVSISLSIVWIIGAATGGASTLTPLKPECSNDNSLTQILSDKPISKSEECLSHAKKGYSVDMLLDEVKASKKPVIVDFTKEACAACKELDVVTFVNPKVKEAFKNYTFIQVDLTDNTEQDQEMLKHFDIFGTPNILFFDKNGQLLKDKTITGFISPDDLMQHLKSIK
ncbi:MAG: protein-disulfide reductase DsbD [Sulfurovaceae bacterium]|nr:protein-disulfide reductase DsbD [Sulfurovaceae bacterium]